MKKALTRERSHLPEVYIKIEPMDSATPIDVIKAFQKANKATESWQKADRGQFLSAITNQIIKAGEDQAKIKVISSETGKPHELVQSQDFVFAAKAFEKAKQDLSEQSQNPNSHQSSYGNAVLITPISTPLQYLAQKISAIMAAGNCVIVKPSSHTTNTAKILEVILNESKVPDGVVNFIYGSGEAISETLLTHPTVDLVMFGGRSQTATKIKKAMVNSNAKLIIDSGSKNSALILNDADLQHAAEILAAAWLSDGGFNIYGPQRIFVDEKLEPEFFEILKVVSESFLRRHFNNSNQHQHLKTGHNADDFKKAMLQIKEEKGELSPLAEGSKNPMHAAPIIVRDLTDCSDIHQREVLGPLMTIRGFKYPFDGVKWANTTTDFRVGAVFSKDKERAQKLALTTKAIHIQLNAWNLNHQEGLGAFQIQRTIID